MSYYTMLSIYGRCTRQFKIGHLHQEVMWQFLWKWKLCDFAFEKRLVGHILNRIIVIWFFNPHHFLKMSKFLAGHVTKMWFLKLWITSFWTQAGFALKLQEGCWKNHVVTFTAHLSVTIKRFYENESYVILPSKNA